MRESRIELIAKVDVYTLKELYGRSVCPITDMYLNFYGLLLLFIYFSALNPRLCFAVALQCDGTRVGPLDIYQIENITTQSY